MANLSDFITEILTGEYGQDVVNYGKDANGDFQPFEVTVDGKQYVVDEDVATKLQTLIDKDFATETTLDTRLSSLETKMDTLLNSQDTDNNLSVKQSGSIDLLAEHGVTTITDGDSYDIIPSGENILPYQIIQFSLGRIRVNGSILTRDKVSTTDIFIRFRFHSETELMGDQGAWQTIRLMDIYEEKRLSGSFTGKIKTEGTEIRNAEITNNSGEEIEIQRIVVRGCK